MFDALSLLHFCVSTYVLKFRHSDSADQNVSKTSRRSEIQEKPDGPKLLERHQERSWQWWAETTDLPLHTHICWFCSSNTLFFSRITLLSLRNAETRLLNITGISGKRQVMFPWRFSWYAVTWLFYLSVLIFTVEAMKRVEEIKQKRQARFIMNRWATSFIFLYFVYYLLFFYITS